MANKYILYMYIQQCTVVLWALTYMYIHMHMHIYMYVLDTHFGTSMVKYEVHSVHRR